jgi:hypothetical protein
MKTINFSDTGLNEEDIERSKVEAGMRFVLTEVNFRNGQSFDGVYATIKAETPQEEEEERIELNLYTVSSVLVTQLRKLIAKYGDPNTGIFKDKILVEVEEREGVNGNYLTFI